MEPWEVVAVQILQKENLSSAILEQNKANTACYEGRLQSLISAFGSYWLLFLGGEFSHIWEVNWYTRKSYAVKFFYFFPILRSYLISINRLCKDFSRVFSLQELKGFPKNNVQWLQLQVHHVLFDFHLISQEIEIFKIKCYFMVLKGLLWCYLTKLLHRLLCEPTGRLSF